MIDPYITLGIKPKEATDKLVADRAKTIIKENHPDKHEPDLTQEERDSRTRRFMEAKESWDLLRTQEDRDNWEKGITKKGMNEFLHTLIIDYTNMVVEMSMNGSHFNPKDRLKNLYGRTIGQLASKKSQTEMTLNRFKKNMKKVTVDEGDPLMRSLLAKKGMMEHEINHIESDISAFTWKLNYLEKNYEWSEEDVLETQKEIVVRRSLFGNVMGTGSDWFYTG